MIIHLLDIAPSPWSEVQRQAYKEAMDQREAKQAQKRAEKQARKAEKNLEKQAKKAEQKLEKQAKKTEKNLEKQAKKAEKKMKKAEKKLDKQFKNFSEAPTKTITTVQEGTENNSEVQYASMPTGLILSVCASLLICLASAWYYRRRSAKA